MTVHHEEPADGHAEEELARWISLYQQVTLPNSDDRGCTAASPTWSQRTGASFEPRPGRSLAHTHAGKANASEQPTNGQTATAGPTLKDLPSSPQ